MLIKTEELAIKLRLKFFILVALIALIVICRDIDAIFFVMGLSRCLYRVCDQLSGLWMPAAMKRRKRKMGHDWSWAELFPILKD